MVLLNPQGQIVEVNRAYTDMLGYSADELMAHDSLPFTHPDDIELTRSFLASLRNGQRETGSIEKRYLRKDGEIVWVCASATMQRDEDGRPAEIVAIVEDITARKRAEARYRFLAEAVPQTVWTAVPDGAIDYVNGRGAEYFGVPPEALIGVEWLDLVHPEDRALNTARWSDSLATGRPYEATIRLRRGCDATWRWHSISATPFLGENGSIAQWFGACTDIQDQKQAIENLREQWQTFDTALSHTPDFAYIFDLEGRFTYVNRALLNLWQKSLEEARGKNFFDLGYPPELADRLQRQIRQVIDSRQNLRDQTPYTDAAGRQGYYEYIFVPVLDADGCVRAVAGTTRDLTEHKKAADQIEEDRGRWRELLSQAPAGIAVLRGPQHRFEWFNADYVRLIGRTAEAIIGKTVEETFPELEGQPYIALLNDVFATGKPFIGHEALFRVDRGDGALEDTYLNFVYSPTRNAAGAIDGVFAHVTEVTDLVRSRKRVEASEERFRLAFKALDGFVYDWNPRAGTVERSGDLRTLLGVGPEDVEPTEDWWQRRVHPDDQAATSLHALASLPADQDHFETEFRIRHADGHWVYACDRGYVVRNEHGEVVRVVGSTHDVSEERTLLRALQESEARFRQAIDSMPQLVWSTRPDGVADLFNKQWFEYTGIDPASATDHDWATAVHPDDLPQMRERWSHSFRTGDPFEFEFRCRRADGQYRWFLTRATPIRDERGSIVRWFGTSTDIEDRKKAELAVIAKQKLESLGLLAGGIAHDFNNILVGVLAGASFAADSLPEVHPLRSTMEEIVSAAERASHLTRQMLAYAGKGRLLIEQIDFTQLLKNTYALIRSSIPKHVDVTFHIGPGLPRVEGDSGQIQQIIMNLILNAAESIDQSGPGAVSVAAAAVLVDSATASGAEVSVGTLLPRSYLVFEVQDNGSGMDAETQTKIFDPFFTTKFTGRGLGLSAVQGILRAHKGAIAITSKVGEGSRFRVFLPASSNAEAPVEPSVKERPGNSGGTVLVVDDEQTVRSVAKLCLERAGFEVMLAESGFAAIDVLRGEKGADVVLMLLDMSMPGMNGKDVMAKVRQAGIEIPVLICSGYSDAEVSREFSGLDIAGFIQKPFSSRQIVAAVRNAIAARHSG
jgi:PAS domain S-box-containing protein